MDSWPSATALCHHVGNRSGRLESRLESLGFVPELVPCCCIVAGRPAVVCMPTHWALVQLL